MYFHLHINSKKWTFYRIKILTCKSFLIASHRNSKKWAFSLREILKTRPFLIALRKMLKSKFFIAQKFLIVGLFFNRLA